MSGSNTLKHIPLLVDYYEFISCVFCEETCPEVFKLNEDGIAEVNNSEGSSENKIQEAIDNCLAGHIYWEE